jgi:hypothetical protein
MFIRSRLGHVEAVLTRNIHHLHLHLHLPCPSTLNISSNPRRNFEDKLRRKHSLPGFKMISVQPMELLTGMT